MEKVLLLITTFLSSFLGHIAVIDFHMVDNITNPQQVLWKNENSLLFVIDGDIWEYSIESRKKSWVGRRKPNEFVGIDSNDNILLCEFEHYIIYSPDEFSTKFTVTRDDVISEFYFFETIRPIYLDEEKVIAVTAMDFLEQYQYLIDLEEGSIREIEIENRGFPVRVPKSIEVKDVHFLNKDIYVVEDVFGNIYLYRETREKILNILPNILMITG